MVTTEVVIGIDGGGSTTRSLCADLMGTALAYAETGGANPEHNADAQQNVQSAIRIAIERAGRTPADVVALVAGISGLNEPADQRWATEHTALPGLTCPRVQINDTEVAHAGAFGTGAGIIAISGTGSMLLAITDTGEYLRNDAFHHYGGAARHLAFETMHRVLLDEAGDKDALFIDALLHYWNVSDLVALRKLVLQHGTQDYRDTKRSFGGMAVLVTDAAAHSPLAHAACDEAVAKLATGIRLLGKGFAGSDVRIVLIGGLACSKAIQEPLTALLATHREKEYRIMEPVLPPVAGAVLLALTHAGIGIDECITERLQASSTTTILKDWERPNR